MPVFKSHNSPHPPPTLSVPFCRERPHPSFPVHLLPLSRGREKSPRRSWGDGSCVQGTSRAWKRAAPGRIQSEGDSSGIVLAHASDSRACRVWGPTLWGPKAAQEDAMTRRVEVLTDTRRGKSTPAGLIPLFVCVKEGAKGPGKAHVISFQKGRSHCWPTGSTAGPQAACIT